MKLFVLLCTTIFCVNAGVINDAPLEAVSEVSGESSGESSEELPAVKYGVPIQPRGRPVVVDENLEFNSPDSPILTGVSPLKPRTKAEGRCHMAQSNQANPVSPGEESGILCPTYQGYYQYGSTFWDFNIPVGVNVTLFCSRFNIRNTRWTYNGYVCDDYVTLSFGSYRRIYACGTMLDNIELSYPNPFLTTTTFSFSFYSSSKYKGGFNCTLTASGTGASTATVASVTTTAAPMTTTSGPMTTTSGPMTTTSGPMTTTAGPVTTTARPVTTTAAPVTTTAAPVTTTAAPVTTTAAPVTTTAAPVTTTLAGGCKQCGAIPPNNRIVNGVQSQQGALPWQVRLYIEPGYLCGGTIIDSCHVLTAAHCVNDITSPADVTVYAGDYQMNTNDTPSEISIQASAVLVHPNYDPVTINNDLAIITLSTCLDLSTIYYEAACLAGNPTTDAYAGETATVSGWGTTSFEGQVSNVLLQTSFPINNASTCAASYGITFNPTTMICGGGGSTNTDSCQGDSGGPLTTTSTSNQAVLTGIVSFGNGCNDPNFPGIYTNVANYQTWITENSGQCVQFVSG